MHRGGEVGGWLSIIVRGGGGDRTPGCSPSTTPPMKRLVPLRAFSLTSFEVAMTDCQSAGVKLLLVYSMCHTLRLSVMAWSTVKARPPLSMSSHTTARVHTHTHTCVTQMCTSSKVCTRKYVVCKLPQLKMSEVHHDVGRGSPPAHGLNVTCSGWTS